MHCSFSNFLFFTILLCFNSIFISYSASLSIETDKEALISFKSLINFENSSSLSSWNHDLSPCNWTGVSCDNASNRVNGLNLSNLGLSGSISPYIGNLSLLRSLELQSNQLVGSFPVEICKLYHLQVLNLSFNSLEGPLPENISSLVELKMLDLMMNRFTGRIPDRIRKFRRLEVLNLAKNEIEGVIPPSIANISLLATLNLGTNSLTGGIPKDLSRLQNLKYLDLTINSLTGPVPPLFYNMSSLVYFALASNFLIGEIPKDISVTLPNLLGLNICINNFTGKIPRSLYNLTNIEIIRMAHNHFEGTVPSGLGKLHNLKMYNIGYNKLVNSEENGLNFIAALANSTNLSFLAVDGNFFRGSIPESVGNLSKHLSKLYMGGNHIYGEMPASISRLTGLTLLDVGSSKITGEIPYEISQFENLQELKLSGNKLSGSIPSSIGNLMKLSLIDLSENELTGMIPATFGNFKSLQSMDLSNNRLSGSIPEEVFNLASLSAILNLSHNLLSGELSKKIGRLESVVTIDLSNNNLFGMIPESIRTCKSLEQLYMANNTFSGAIPRSMGELRGLETLDLSYNHLSGIIPSDLQGLQVLKLLNLSFNDLEGEVPRGGIFTNLSQVQLQGNPLLCMLPGCGRNNDNKRRIVMVCIIISATVVMVVTICVGLLVYLRSKGIAPTSKAPDLLSKQHQLVLYDELRRATGGFDKENLVGIGSFGSVYKGKLGVNTAVAIKVFNIEMKGFQKSFLAECEALRHARHRNLVKLITCCSGVDPKGEEFLALVYEFQDNGSLRDYIDGKRDEEKREGLNLIDRLNIAIDIAAALDYLHHDCEVPLVHCDLKPSNILLDKDLTAKVGDFGLAAMLIEKMGEQVTSISSSHVLKGSIGYIPPEYGFGVKPSTTGDVYSFGITLLELFTGKSPIDDSFSGEVSLVDWVQSTFRSKTLQVVDHMLALHMNSLSYNGQMINKETQLNCLIQVLGVGLSCATSFPNVRISIRDALHELVDARNSLLRNNHAHKSKYRYYD